LAAAGLPWSFGDGGFDMAIRFIVLALTAFASLASAADLPNAKVTGLRNGDVQKYTHEDGRDATALGLAIAIFSTARLEFDSTPERWGAAVKRDHVRVSFAQPLTLRANTAIGVGKTYAVDEILIATTPFAKRPPLPTSPGQDYIAFGDKVNPGLEDSLMVRSGDKYFSFIKYEGVLIDPLITIYGPRDGTER
jgi:hypothetical protein